MVLELAGKFCRLFHKPFWGRNTEYAVPEFTEYVALGLILISSAHTHHIGALARAMIRSRKYCRGPRQQSNFMEILPQGIY
jgi:hypothetical protein